MVGSGVVICSVRGSMTDICQVAMVRASGEVFRST
jgi:hypothetical protein